MPVRGRGWYKKPYKVRLTFHDGRIQTKSFHWMGPWKDEIEWATRLIPNAVSKLEVWAETGTDGRAERIAGRE